MPGKASEHAIGRGVALATAAALAFGVTTPIVAWAGRTAGAFSTAALLILGAALAAFGLRLVAGRSQAPLHRADYPRVLAVALVGGALAPTLLAWGLQRAGATLGSLLLNLEAVFTIGLARALYREPIGRRVAIAVLAMVAGGLALTLDAWHTADWSVLGVLAVAAATMAWAADNTLTRPLAERDPIDVVAGKASLGVVFTGVAAFALHEPWPSFRALLVLIACGATGYGFSLRLYLLAQRRIGAGRTGSVFALAPFIGAAIAFALGDRSGGAWTVAAAALFGVGVLLHATERHAHVHIHEPVEHEHPHRHDDDHHAHHHDPQVIGEHNHLHRHGRLTHEHDHAPDIHHGHAH